MRDEFESERKRVLLGVDYSRSANDALPRLLDRAGCRTTLICPPNILIARTGLVDRVILCGSDKDQFLAAFCAELSRGTYDWAVLGHDYQRELLNMCERDALDSWFSVPVGDRSKHFVFAKNDFLNACRDANIPVPPFALCSSEPEAQAAAEAIEYPVLVKLAAGYAGSTTFLARNKAELESILGRIDLNEPFAVQKMIEGRIGSTDVLFDHGRALCRLSSYNGDCIPTPFSPKTARRIIESAAVDEIVDRIGLLATYHGLAGIDWIQDAATGAFFVLEISPNPDGGYSLTADAEEAFAGAIRAMLTGDAAYKPHSVKSRAEWIPIFPEWSEYFVQCADRWSPMMWLRFLRMLMDASYRDRSIAFRQLRLAIRAVALPGSELANIPLRSAIRAVASPVSDPAIFACADDI